MAGSLMVIRATALGVALGISGISAALAQSAQNPELLYVCVQDDARIAVIDMRTQALLRTIDLTRMGFTATAKPHHIAVEADGAHWYLSLIGANRVVKFDRSDDIVGQFEMETPGMLSLTPSSDVLAVSRSMSAVNPPPRVVILKRSTMSGDELDVLFPRPHPMIVARNGYAYTGSLGVNQIASISLENDRVDIVRVPGNSHSFVQFALSPDERTLVVSTDVSGQLLVFSLADPARPSLVKSIAVGAMAFDPAFTPDGRFLWVPVKSRNEIAVIETAGWTIANHVRGAALRQPHQIVFSADGARAFVSNNNKMDHMADPSMPVHDAHAGAGAAAAAAEAAAGMAGGKASLVVVDTRSLQITKTIELGLNLTGMGTRARQ
jgi:DNA-binding beta-propeller fold protein YncE